MSADAAHVGLGQLRQQLQVEVGRHVAVEVVAGVHRGVGGAAEDLGLVGGLDLVGAGEEAADGDPRLDEGGVVGALAEVEELVVDALRGQGGDQGGRDRVGALGADTGS